METKVIHAKAFEPLYGTEIVIFIKNFKKPEKVGTEISAVIDKRVNTSLAYQIAIMHNTGRVPHRLRVFKADSF
jgi:aspartokinase